jgi:hypothetical protein
VIAMSSLRRAIFGTVTLAVLTVCLAFAGSATAATTAWWQLNAVSAPAHLPPGGSGTIIVSATDLGDAEVNTSNVPVKLIDKLPPNVTAASASGKAGLFGIRGSVECSVTSPTLVECTFEGKLPAYEGLEIEIAVTVGTEAQSSELNEVSVSGGESYACNEVAFDAGSYTNSGCSSEGEGSFEKQLSGKPLLGASATRQLVVSSTPTPFGVEDYELTASNEDGSRDTQAGSHPFSLTTTLTLNRSAGQPYQPALPKDLNFKLPPGLIGNPSPFPQCSDVAFAKVYNFINDCPAATVLGVASVSIRLPGAENQVLQVAVPVFNLKPAIGEPARFGFEALAVPVTLDTSVRTGGDYGVTVSVENITQTASFYGSQVTFWGVPGDSRHDQSRGWACLGIWGLIQRERVGPCDSLGQSQPPPLLALPTSCTGALQTSVLADSWAQAGSFQAPVEPAFEQSLDGCDHLQFTPSISVVPDGQAGSTPTGLTVGVHVPQDLMLNPNGLAEADVKDTTVTLPAGVGLNPAAADGLESCTDVAEAGRPEGEIALNSATPIACPEASKVATVEIKSPLLPNPLVGAAYLAAQTANPFKSLVALYLVAEDPVSGTLIKVAGEVKLDPVTGQLVTTFENTPQLPFEDLKLHFFGGDRAPLATPALCGSYTTSTSIAPWSGNEPATPSSTFEINAGPHGAPCSNPLPFSPSLTAGTTSIQAGGFSPFTMTMSRGDGNQNLKAVQLHMPPGLLGTLSSVKLCPEGQANAGTCGPESEIGETTVSVGLGGNPFSVTGGRVYITGPYNGAPYGLSIVNPAKAGPYDLGNVIVRAKIEVDPITSALTITTDGSGPYVIPHILDGIPLQIQHINVIINRPNFTFNPTNCSPTAITGSLTSGEGASSTLKVPFQVTNCATLAFKPQFKVSTAGKTSRATGASLDVKLSYPKAAWGSQANIKSVKVNLPKQLPSRLTTLQKACPDNVFEANPASCPAASRIGTATATTPIIPVALSGPAYFVSHGGLKFPELVVVLSGYGVTVYLHGETFISTKGITSSTFRAIPDVPIGSFELKLPQGPFSALGANANLCKVKGGLKMPTAFTAQNGLVIKQSTPVGVTGCPKAKKAKKPKKKQGQTEAIGPNIFPGRVALSPRPGEAQADRAVQRP